jgi:3-methyl-2-oxobutanoate hydroxymethyltransferase
MNAISLARLKAMKKAGEKFAVLTAYDATFARLAEVAGIEVILVGDSLGNVCLGYKSTVPVTMADMVHHTSAVARGNSNSFVVADMPYMAYGSDDQAIANAALLMQAGAQMVKLEGGAWLAPTILKLTERGVPVCGHLGLTPQSVDKLGGYKVQGRDKDAAQKMLDDARTLEEAGADMLVLECVPSALGESISNALGIPVIGIGAGKNTDAQVLVIYDILGISAKIPKFAKNFLIETGDIAKAIAAYGKEVRAGSFPEQIHCFD